MSKPEWVPTEEILQKVETLAGQGMFEQDIAYCVGIHPNTFSEKKTIYPELGEAIKKGKAKGIEEVTKSLLENIKEKNVTAQIFYLKTQAKWREQDSQDADETKKQLLESVKEIVNKCLKQV